VESCEEVVVAGGRKIESARLAAMDRNDVIEPHRQVGQIFRKDSMRKVREEGSL